MLVRAENNAAVWLEDSVAGYKVNVSGLQESPLNSGGTLLTAYHNGDPGAFLEIEYLCRPSGFEAYLKATALGYSMFEAKERESKEITLDGKKAKWRVFDGELEGPCTLFHVCTIPDSDKDFFWSFGGICSGEDLAAVEKHFGDAIKSFAAAAKPKEKPSKSLYVSEAFGFSIDLAGFKGPNNGPENAILAIRGLSEGKTALGTFAVIAATPFDADFTKHVEKVIQGHERGKRKITSRKDQDCAGRKAVLLEYEYDQAGRPTKVQQLVLVERGVAISVSASWRPTDCEGGKEKPLLDAVKSFTLTRAAAKSEKPKAGK